MRNYLSGLRRSTIPPPYESGVICLDCALDEAGLPPLVAGKKARDHTRETGHTTRVRQLHIIQYEAVKELADLGKSNAQD